MKTTQIVSTLRNSETPAARLAAWQAPAYGGRSPLTGNLETLRKAKYHGYTLAARRKSLIDSTGPELSSPEAEKPLLWLSGDSDPEVLTAFAGRDFLDHRGWFADDYQDATLETYAIQLRRFPHLLFYGIMSEGGLRVELDDWEEIDFSECESDYDVQDAIQESARSVVRSNDSSTEREAKDECEYQRKWGIENAIEENKETLKTLRGEIRALAHELKQLCPSALAMEYPAAGKAVIASLRDLLGERRQLMERNQELAASL